MGLRLPRHRLDVLGSADVAGVETKPLHPGFEGGKGEAVLEVDVGDDGNRAAGDDLGEAAGGVGIVARDADDVGPGGGEGVHLGESGVDVGRLRRRHRLDAHRRPSPDGDGTDLDLPCQSALDHVPMLRRPGYWR